MSRLFDSFLGEWILIPESCSFEQGEPPTAGLYRIEAAGDQLTFTIISRDADGDESTVTFSGIADGVPAPFAGGPLIDALSIKTVSSRELNSCGYYGGVECMVAQRQLDESGNAMRVTQLVRFDDGTRLSNVAVYRRRVLN